MKKMKMEEENERQNFRYFTKARTLIYVTNATILEAYGLIDVMGSGTMMYGNVPDGRAL